jgi:hypothetical protein
MEDDCWVLMRLPFIGNLHEYKEFVVTDNILSQQYKHESSDHASVLSSKNKYLIFDIGT